MFSGTAVGVVKGDKAVLRGASTEVFTSLAMCGAVRPIDELVVSEEHGLGVWRCKV